MVLAVSELGGLRQEDAKLENSLGYKASLSQSGLVRSCVRKKKEGGEGGGREKDRQTERMG